METSRLGFLDQIVIFGSLPLCCLLERGVKTDSQFDQDPSHSSRQYQNDGQMEQCDEERCKSPGQQSLLGRAMNDERTDTITDKMELSQVLNLLPSWEALHVFRI